MTIRNENEVMIFTYKYRRFTSSFSKKDTSKGDDTVDNIIQEWLYVMNSYVLTSSSMASS